MKKMIKNLLIIALFIAISSCGDDKSIVVNPILKSPDIPLENGNTWGYDGYYYDEDEDVEISYISTNEIGDKETYEGRQANRFIRHQTYNGPIITHISKDEEGVFYYFKKIEEFATPLDTVEPGWIKLYDFDKDNWKSYDEEFSFYKYKDEAKAHIVISGSNLGTEEVTYKGKSYEANKYQMKIEKLHTRVSDNRVIFREVVTVDYLVIDGIGVYSEYVIIDNNSEAPIIESFILK